MFYLDSGAETFGETARYLAADPVLTEGCVNKNPCRDDQEQHGEEEPQ